MGTRTYFSTEGNAAVPWGRVVDGGYYDNSGIATLADVANAFVKAAKDFVSRDERYKHLRFQVFVILISNDPELSLATAPPPERPFAAPEYSQLTCLAQNPSDARKANECIEAGSSSLKMSEILSPIEAFMATRPAHAFAEKQSLFAKFRI